MNDRSGLEQIRHAIHPPCPCVHAMPCGQQAEDRSMTDAAGGTGDKDDEWGRGGHARERSADPSRWIQTIVVAQLLIQARIVQFKINRLLEKRLGAYRKELRFAAGGVGIEPRFVGFVPP